MYNMSIVNTAVWYIGKLSRELILRVLTTRRNIFVFFYIYMKWWVLTKSIVILKYVKNWSIMLFTLNLYSDACQVFQWHWKTIKPWVKEKKITRHAKEVKEKRKLRKVKEILGCVLNWKMGHCSSHYFVIIFLNLLYNANGLILWNILYSTKENIA